MSCCNVPVSEVPVDELELLPSAGAHEASAKQPNTRVKTVNANNKYFLIFAINDPLKTIFVL